MSEDDTTFRHLPGMLADALPDKLAAEAGVEDAEVARIAGLHRRL